MGALNFDARTVAPAIGLDPVPDSWYKVVVSKSNIKPTSKGDGGLLELILTIIEGQFQNRSVYWNLNLFNPSAQAVEIAYKQLSALCHVVGQFQINDQQVPDNNVPALHNIPFNAHIVVAQGTKGPINNVIAVKDINGNDPGKQAQGTQAATPFAQPALQPSSAPGFVAPAGYTPQQQPQQQPGAWQPQQQPAQAQPQNPGWTAGGPQQQPQMQPQPQLQPQPQQQPGPGTWNPNPAMNPNPAPMNPQQQPGPQPGPGASWQAPGGAAPGGAAPGANAPWQRPG